MKRTILVCVMLMLSFVLIGCQKEKAAEQTQFWGSYTDERTYSFDKKYYAVQTVRESDEIRYILVTIYDIAANHEVSSFMPARASDFWGICWERDTYNIWIQSADIGAYCYEYQNGNWIRNESVRKPDYIISRNDTEYRNNAELQKDMYKSPTE